VFVSHSISSVCGVVASRHGFKIVIAKASFRKLTCYALI
jgi:hypothetical protein